MNARRLILATFCMVMGVFVVLSASALALATDRSGRALVTPGQAANGHVFDGSFGAEGPGTISFGLGSTQSIAVDESTGDVYVYSASIGRRSTSSTRKANLLTSPRREPTASMSAVSVEAKTRSRSITPVARTKEISMSRMAASSEKVSRSMNRTATKLVN